MGRENNLGENIADEFWEVMDGGVGSACWLSWATAWRSDDRVERMLIGALGGGACGGTASTNWNTVKGVLLMMRGWLRALARCFGESNVRRRGGSE